MESEVRSDTKRRAALKGTEPGREGGESVEELGNFHGQVYTTVGSSMVWSIVVPY